MNIQEKMEVLVNHLSQWVLREDTDNGFYSKRKEKFESEISSTEQISTVRASTAAFDIAYQDTIVGTYSILQGDQHGWGKVYCALKLHYWSMKVYFKHQENLGKLHDGFLYPFDTFALNFCFSVLLEQNEMAMFYAQHIKSFYEHDIAFDTCDNESFKSFILGFVLIYLDDSSIPKSSVSGIYERLFIGLNNHNIASKDILSLCDYHLNNAHEYNDKNIEPSDLIYSVLPFSVFPVEILALIKFSEKFGVTSDLQQMDHPLLNTQLCKIQKYDFNCDDENVLQFIDKVKKWGGLN